MSSYKNANHKAQNPMSEYLLKLQLIVNNTEFKDKELADKYETYETKQYGNAYVNAVLKKDSYNSYEYDDVYVYNTLINNGIDEDTAYKYMKNQNMIPPKIKGIMTRERKKAKAQQIVDAGIGFTSRGCIRKCPFCFVPKKEGAFRQDSEIKDIINPRSNVIIIHDNNLTADPYCIDKLHEIRDRNLIVDINQGCDVRLMTPEIAQAMSEVHHLRSLHYAWDLMAFENQVIEGISIMSRFIPASRHMCFCLVGFNTTFDEDMYRVKKLELLGVRPYIMRYNERRDDIRLNHFARWVNAFIYKAVPDFEEYEPWKRDKGNYDCIEKIMV